MRKFSAHCLAMSFIALLALLPTASAETSIFELRVTNNTDRDLTFILKDDHSKHVDLTHKKAITDRVIIKPGTSDIVGIKPDGHKCAPTCGVCSPAKGRVYAWYYNDKGEQVRNNYYEASVEFFEYCGTTAGKPLTTYTSNWNLEKHQGQGNNRFKHKDKSSHNNYTRSDPAQGLTMDAKKIHGHATIVYSIR